MTTYGNFLLSHIPDNEVAYFTMLEGAISSVDRHYYLSITSTPTAYNIRITLSAPEMVNSLILQLNTMNNALGIHLEYSKSVKKGNIFFKLNLENKK